MTLRNYREVRSMDNMTALVSTFARAYHYKNNHIHIFADLLAEKMLTDEEYTILIRILGAVFASAGCALAVSGF